MCRGIPRKEIRMALVTFSKQEKEALTAKLRSFVADELDHTMGSFEAGFLLNFIAEEIGPYFYNLALRDAQAMLGKRMDGIASAIDELTKPVGERR